MSAVVIDDITFKPYLDRFNEIVEMLAHLETGSKRRDAVEVLRGAIAGLNGLKRSDQSAIGETVVLLEARVPVLADEEISVPIVERLRTLADDLKPYDFPVDAWRAIRILASQYTSPQEKEDARRRRVKIRFAPTGGRPRDYRRDIAVIIAAELYEKLHEASPRANRGFVSFCQQVYIQLGLTADKDVAGLEDRVRRTLRDLGDPDAPA